MSLQTHSPLSAKLNLSSLENDEVAKIQKVVAQCVAAERIAIELGADDPEPLPGAEEAAALRDTLSEAVTGLADEVMARPINSIADLYKRVLLLRRHYPDDERELVTSEIEGERWIGSIVEGVIELFANSARRADA